MERMLIDALKKQHLPALLLNMDSLKQNVQQIMSTSQNKTIRIATKSIRSVQVLKRLLQMDPFFQGLMCFTAAEAVFLSEQGFDDLLIGYPSNDERALTKIAQLNRFGKTIYCMVDDQLQVELLERLANEADGFFKVCIDIDMSTSFGGFHFGVRRSPLATPEEVVSLAEYIKETETIDLAGLMGYEAQLAGVTDQSGQFFKDQAVRFMKRKSVQRIAAHRTAVVAALEAKGFFLAFVNGGGTGSMNTTVLDKSVTEVTVGSGIYTPLLFDRYLTFQYKPALFFALPVVRQPHPEIYTCLGGGYIASGSVGKDKTPQPIYPKGAKLLSLEGAGEVQTPIRLKGESLSIGDPVLFRAAKAGEICERFDDMLVIEGGEITDRYTTYRGEGACFL
ncbi:amino acid deaminase/aldolase [Bacillus sp. JCM 19041]|uniref:amino acid deaminase/aldolase n=1 Tax=Bacillus sp. JCM 19041 TaxID=1460637 RepID=UPI0006CF5E90